MLTTAILNEFIHKIYLCLNQREDSAWKSYIGLAKRVDELGKHVVKTMRFQGYSNIFFGLIGATASFAGAFTSQKTVEKTAEAFKGLSQSSDRVVSSFSGATQTQSQQRLAQKRDIELSQARKLEEETAKTCARLEHQVDKVVDTQSASAAYRSR